MDSVFISFIFEIQRCSVVITKDVIISEFIRGQKEFLGYSRGLSVDVNGSHWEVRETVKVTESPLRFGVLV